jgi:hypothetical protein
MAFAGNQPPRIYPHAKLFTMSISQPGPNRHVTRGEAESFVHLGERTLEVHEVVNEQAVHRSFTVPV